MSNTIEAPRPALVDGKHESDEAILQDKVRGKTRRIIERILGRELSDGEYTIAVMRQALEAVDTHLVRVDDFGQLRIIMECSFSDDKRPTQAYIVAGDMQGWYRPNAKLRAVARDGSSPSIEQFMVEMGKIQNPRENDPIGFGKVMACKDFAKIEDETRHANSQGDKNWTPAEKKEFLAGVVARVFGIPTKEQVEDLEDGTENTSMGCRTMLDYDGGHFDIGSTGRIDHHGNVEVVRRGRDFSRTTNHGKEYLSEIPYGYRQGALWSIVDFIVREIGVGGL